MENNYENIINEMVSELNGIQEIAIDNNVFDLNKSQVSVESMDSQKVVINFKLNKKGVTLSSLEDPNGSQRFPDSRSDRNDANNLGSFATNETIDDKTQDIIQNNSNTSMKSRYSRRTISESINEETKKGILKYSQNWNRRTVSESNCDSVDIDFDLLSVFWHSVEDVYSDDELSEKKHKKNVRFSENVSKTIFRPNSSILGRKQKNQKRAKNRKSNRKNVNNSTEDISTKTECERTRQDSGYDSEDNVLHIQNEISLKTHQKSTENTIETGIEKLHFN